MELKRYKTETMAHYERERPDVLFPFQAPRPTPSEGVKLTTVL